MCGCLLASGFDCDVVQLAPVLATIRSHSLDHLLLAVGLDHSLMLVIYHIVGVTWLVLTYQLLPAPTLLCISDVSSLASSNGLASLSGSGSIALSMAVLLFSVRGF